MKTSTWIIGKYEKNEKPFGPKRKFDSKDEFLITLMKLRSSVLIW